MIRGSRGAYARFLDSIGCGRDNPSVDPCPEGVFQNVGWIGWAKELIESAIKSKSGGGVWCGVYLCVERLVPLQWTGQKLYRVELEVGGRK